MPPTLEEALTIRLYRSKEETLSLNSTKGDALRFIFPLNDGFLRCEDFSADFVQGGSDWLHLDPSTGTAHLDAYVQFREQQTGDTLYLPFTGIMRLDPVIEKVLAWSPDAKTTEEKDHYSFVSPMIEVSGARHKWMEGTAFVGHGHYYMPGDGTNVVESEIYQLVTG